MPEAPVITQVQQSLPIEPQIAPEPAEAPTEPEVTVAQAPTAPAEGEKPTGETPEKPDPTEKPGKSRFERRLDKAYKRAAEAEARARVVEQELLKTRELNKPKDESEPRLDQFDDIEKYAQAKAKYQVEKELKSRDQKYTEQSFDQFRQKASSEWEEKVSGVEIDDFEDKVGELKPESPLHIAIMQSDPRVAYFLATHPQEAKRVAMLDFVSQLREIGKLEAKVTAEPVKPKPSKAPAPIKPLTGVADTSGEPDSEKDPEAWIKWRSKKVHAKR